MTITISHLANDGWMELDGERSEGLAASVTQRTSHDGYLWVDIERPDSAPSTEAEFRVLSEDFGFHPMSIEDALSEIHQPKVQVMDGHVIAIVWRIDPDDRSSSRRQQLALLVRAGVIVTVHATGTNIRAFLDDALSRSRIEDTGAPMDDALGGLYLVLDAIVRDYAAIAYEIEQELEELEQKEFRSTEEGARAEAIYAVKQRVARAHRAASALDAALHFGLDRVQADHIDDENLIALYGNLVHDVGGITQMLSDQDDSVETVLTAHENDVSITQNRDMRKISAIAALLAVPTVIAGIYGMNFKTLPGLDIDLGWLAVIGGILVIDVAMIVLFRRRGWL